jgi:hypothetical protein
VYIIRVTFLDRLDWRRRYWAVRALYRGREHWDVAESKKEATKFATWEDAERAIMRFNFHFPLGQDDKVQICQAAQPFRLSAGTLALFNGLGE